MNYTLNSLHLGTDYDTRVRPLEIPAVANLGSEKALSILDGANRAPRRLARLVKPVGLLGLKVATNNGVRVTVTLQSDRVGTQIWNRMYSTPDEEPVLENEFRNHRLIEVTAQGRTRGILMLARRGADKGPVMQRLTFDLEASEIGDSGLLMVGFEEPRYKPGWATNGLLETPLVGVCVTSIRLQPIEQAQVGPRLSGGRPLDATLNVPLTPGFFVLNPGTTDGEIRLSLRPRMRTRLGHVRRQNVAARLKALRGGTASVAAPADEQLPEMEIQAVSASGDPVAQASVSPTQGAYVVDLPAAREALYVRITPTVAVPRLRGFKARVTPREQ